MNEDKNFSILRKVSESTETTFVVIEVNLELFRSDIENKNEHSHVLKDVISLRLKVLLHEAVLTTAIPEWEYEVT